MELRVVKPLLVQFNGTNKPIFSLFTERNWCAATKQVEKYLWVISDRWLHGINKHSGILPLGVYVHYLSHFLTVMEGTLLSFAQVEGKSSSLFQVEGPLLSFF